MNYTVNVSLPKQLAKLAKTRVKDGHYASLSEVIRDALRQFLGANVPVYPMSTKTERKAKQALKEHQKGKSTLLHNLDDLNDL